jgi:flagellar motor switch protein FliG
MDVSNLPGSYKVAVLVHALGPDASGSLMRNMSESETEKIHQYLNELGSVSPDVVEAVSREFLNAIKQPSKSKTKSKNSSAGNNGSGEEADSENGEKKAEALKILEGLEPEQIREMIKDEHPQTIAALALHLDTKLASDVISGLPDELIIEVSLRVARLDKILSSIIQEVDAVFQEILSSKKGATVQKTSGVAQLAEILNYSDQIIAEQILNDIEKSNSDLADEIKQRMFIFDDLVLIDDKGIQKVLRKVETAELGLALKGASDETKHKIFKNMSKRAAEMLSEEIDSMGAVRMSDVETAQQGINKIIQQMAASNDIIISGRGGEEFIA